MDNSDLEETLTPVESVYTWAHEQGTSNMVKIVGILLTIC